MTIEPAAKRRHRVVIIGSGFGGLAAAKALKKADVEVTLIAKTTHHLFQPLLYQVATGVLSEGEIAPATRVILSGVKNCKVLLGTVTDIDLTNKTVTSHLVDWDTVTPFDSLICAAGASSSYFGRDEFGRFAPGMKTIDDALELRGRILGAFEAAEVTTDLEERARRMTFVVVGAGPTGVEVAGQIAEIADRTLKGTFRNIDSRDCRVILLDAADKVLAPMGENLGLKAQRRLQKLGVEIQLGAMVTNVDYNGIEIKDMKTGETRRIPCAVKVWSAGVAASPLGKMIAEQSDGTTVDRAGRVIVEPDLTVKGHPYVFVVGDIMNVPNVPGMAQGAIQGAKYAAKRIKDSLNGHDDPSNRKPFSYWDKGSMATVSRFSAVCKVPLPGGRTIEFGGFIAWLSWLALHIFYLVGHKNRFTTIVSWFITFIGRGRGQLAITERFVYGRLAMEKLQHVEKAPELPMATGPVQLGYGATPTGSESDGEPKATAERKS